jgi:AcrR family transcriptional regulator
VDIDDETPAPLRRDAERNRERILTAARRLFSETGLAVSHNDVARAAGVGVGTVYRRFPRKEDLLLALFEDQVEQVVQLAETAGARADPWRGLYVFLEAMLQMQADDRGLHEYLLGSQAPSLAGRATERISPVVGAVLDRARGVAPDQWRRVLALVMDGFRPPAEGSLPGQPLDPVQLEHVFTSWKGRST